MILSNDIGPPTQRASSCWCHWVQFNRTIYMSYPRWPPQQHQHQHQWPRLPRDERELSGPIDSPPTTL